MLVRRGSGGHGCRGRHALLAAARAGAALVAAAVTVDGGLAPPEAERAAPVASVEGPPARVVRFLRERGYDARARDGEVEVRGAEPNAVESELGNLPPGDVPVYVR